VGDQRTSDVGSYIFFTYQEGWWKPQNSLSPQADDRSYRYIPAFDGQRSGEATLNVAPPLTDELMQASNMIGRPTSEAVDIALRLKSEEEVSVGRLTSVATDAAPQLTS
jgi:hypothetical protein